MTSKRKTQKSQAPTWLDAAVYEPKRQRSAALVKQAVDTLVEQRKQDGVTRVSLSTITAMARQLDPEGKGVAHTTILENEEAYVYYKRFRTTGKPKRPSQTKGDAKTAPKLPIKTDRNQNRARQRYMKLSRSELVEQLLSVEQRCSEIHERWLALNDRVLEWQLRAEQAETQLQMFRGAKP